MFRMYVTFSSLPSSTSLLTLSPHPPCQDLSRFLPFGIFLFFFFDPFSSFGHLYHCWIGAINFKLLLFLLFLLLLLLLFSFKNSLSTSTLQLPSFHSYCAPSIFYIFFVNLHFQESFIFLYQ